MIRQSHKLHPLIKYIKHWRKFNAHTRKAFIARLTHTYALLLGFLLLMYLLIG